MLPGDPAMMNFYAGPFAIGLALWALWCGNGRLRLLGLSAVVTGLLAMGGYLPGYQFLRIFHVFRFPASWLLVTSAAVAVLAGWGITLLPGKIWKMAACTLVMLDLGIFHQAIQVAWFPPSFLDQPPAELKTFLGQPDPGRLFVSDNVLLAWLTTPLNNTSDYEFFKSHFIPSYPTAFGAREVNSYQILQTKRWGTFVRRLHQEGPQTPLRRWAGIAMACILEKGATRVTPNTLHVIPFSDFAPPLFWASSTRADGIDVQRNQPGHVEATVTSKDSADLLVFSEMLYPGWKASIDGHSAVLIPFSDAFLAIHVPAGSHRILFNFYPNSFAVGGLITLMSALLLWKFRRFSFIAPVPVDQVQ